VTCPKSAILTVKPVTPRGASDARTKRVVHNCGVSWHHSATKNGNSHGADEVGLVARSRRPHRSPQAMPLAIAQEIVRLRAQLLADGLDAGALTIQ
jgi:hypothetical protein